MEETNPLRVVLLGKTGAGKSSVANTIFGKKIFVVNDSPNSETKTCQSYTDTVSGRSLCLIDTPGLFDTDPESSELSPELLKCITECAPGPHAFVLVLKVEKFPRHEQAVVDVTLKYFTDEALKYTTVVFTHGESLSGGTSIEDWANQNQALKNLIQKCSGRCHVIDNKYWNNTQDKPNPYRANQYQVEQLLKTIEKTVTDNKGGFYTNGMLQTVNELSEQDIRGNDKQNKLQFLTKLTGLSVGVLLGAFLGGGCMLAVVLYNLPKLPIQATASLAGAGAVVGAGVGGWKGYKASDQSETPAEAAQAACEDVKITILQIKDMLQDRSGTTKSKKTWFSRQSH